MTNETTQIERISSLIEQYLSSFGQARIAFYSFPSLEDHRVFTRYLNSFISALKRANCRPAYSWNYDSCRGCYKMILIVSGYFRDDMNDITDAAQRIWKYYSPFPIQYIAEMPVRYETVSQDKMSLFDIMSNMAFVPTNPQRLLPPHHRAFACSKLY